MTGFSSLNGKARLNSGHSKLPPVDTTTNPLAKRDPVTSVGAAPGSGTTPGVTTSMTPPPPTPGLVHLWSPELDKFVSARHVEAPQITKERAGGWEQVDRPGLLPLTTRSNPQLIKLRLVLLFDGWSPPKRSVQPELDTLRRLGYREADRDERTVVVVGAVPYSDSGLNPGFEKTAPTWVVEDLKIVEELHTSSGSPCRAVATVDLLEYAPASVEIRVDRRRREQWLKGDTLQGFARRVYRLKRGSEIPAATRAIRDANPQIRKFSQVRAGDYVTVPPRRNLSEVTGPFKAHVGNAAGLLQ